MKYCSVWCWLSRCSHLDSQYETEEFSLPINLYIRYLFRISILNFNFEIPFQSSISNFNFEFQIWIFNFNFEFQFQFKFQISIVMFLKHYWSTLERILKHPWDILRIPVLQLFDYSIYIWQMRALEGTSPLKTGLFSDIDQKGG